MGNQPKPTLFMLTPAERRRSAEREASETMRDLAFEKREQAKLMKALPMLLVRTRGPVYAVERIQRVGQELMAWAREERTLGVNYRPAALTILILVPGEFTHTWRPVRPDEDHTLMA